MFRPISDPSLIYNLFPRLYHTVDDWKDQLDHIISMGFNSVYINPFHATGGSRSLYAVKDYFRLNAEFLKPGADDTDFAPLRNFLKAAQNKGVVVIMDLVINHTANESVLVKEHPSWFKWEGSNLVHPYAIDPANSSNVTVWGDLAEINYEHDYELENMRNYWDSMISFYQQLGFKGFRCDAAYKVPCKMWQPLIRAAKNRNPGTFFLAETLGCTLQQVSALGHCGFDYLFNSSKWWNFEGPWCIDQHASFKSIAPSISFPETHDTARVASEPPGSLEWQKNRYVLAAIYSKGLLMPIGYEFGATKKLDVVGSRPDDNYPGRWDIRTWISQVNKLKLGPNGFDQEGSWEAVWGYDDQVIFLLRSCERYPSNIGLLVNKDWYNAVFIDRDRFPWQFGKFKNIIQIFESPMRKRPIEKTVCLAPSEIVLFTE